jgi:MFS family permease
MLLMLIPSVIYTVMFIGQRFPETERKAAGVSSGEMMAQLARPLFVVIFISMCLTAATELGAGQWYANVFNEVMASTARAGILVLVWVNGIMWVMRQFFGGVSHRVSPVALIAVTALPAAAGLYLFSLAASPLTAFAAAALLALGTAFWWPTMLGITSERFPRGGALALAIIGGTGSFATAIAGPVMGYLNDRFGPREMLAIWAILPLVIALIFLVIYMRDRATGGYKVEKLQTRAGV